MMFSPIRRKLILPIVTCTTLLLSACSGNSPSTGGGSNPSPAPAPSAVAAPMTIDDVGTVPVFYGSSTSSIIYVQNNTNDTISDITYTSAVNTTNNSSVAAFTRFMAKIKSVFKLGDRGNSFINPQTAAICANVSGNQACSLGFTVPAGLDTGGASAFVTLSYKYKGQQYTFTKLINFEAISPTSINGVSSASGVNITNTGNYLGYGDVFVYGTGLNNFYKVQSISASSNVNVLTNISGQTIQSLYVQAIRVSTPFSNNGQNQKTSTLSDASVTITTLDTYGNQSTNSISVSVTPTNNNAYLIAGLVPPINTGESDITTGSIYIANVGQVAANLGTISYPNGTQASGGTCGSTLGINQSCTLNFNVISESGQGSLNVPYTWGSAGSSTLYVDLSWYNPSQFPLLGVSTNLSSDTAVFSATVGTPESTPIQVTVKNVGHIDITNFQPSYTTREGVATVTESNISCTQGGTNLGVGQQCTYNIYINDPLAENGDILLIESGQYNGGSVYSRALDIMYNSLPYTPNVQFQNAPLTLQTAGDNVESDIETYTIKNSGPATANFSSNGALYANPSYLALESTTCESGSSLPAGSSCTATFKLGPTIASVESIESTSYFQVNYTGGSQITPESTSGFITTIVLPESQNLIIKSISTTPNIQGSGSSTNPFTIYGYNLTTPTSEQITFTYQNNGTESLTLVGESDPNSGQAWQIDSTSSCVNYTGVTLAVGATCTLIYDNVLNTTAEAGLGVNIGVSYTENLLVPTIIFSDLATGNQFVQTPLTPGGGNTVYVNGNQAAVVNFATESGTGHTFTVGHSMSNGAGYSAIAITSTFEDYSEPGGYSGNVATLSSSNGCMATPPYDDATSYTTQNCSLSASTGNDIESVTYTIESYYVGQTENVNFTVNSNTFFSMTPTGTSVITQ